MRKAISTFAILAALVSTGAVNIAAQAPTTPAQTPQSPTPSATADQRPADQAVLKLTGCLKNEKDVAGLKANMAERAGITEDYILTAVKVSGDSQVSGLGVGAMYEIEGIAEAELKKHLNHQVELSGRIEGAAGSGTGMGARTASGSGTGMGARPGTGAGTGVGSGAGTATGSGAGTGTRTGSSTDAHANAGARNRDDVPDFRATSLRMLAATCPAQ